MKALLVGVAIALTAGPAAAQTPANWEPFLGCWELTWDTLSQGPTPTRPANRSLANGSPADGRPRVCVTRTPEGGARFETTVRGQAAIDQTIIADATDRPFTDDECMGVQRAEFSSNGLRVFSRAELTCKDDAGPRRVSGISLLANGLWLDIQAVEIASRETVRVRRYSRAVGDAPVPRQRTAGSTLTLDDVQEASTKVVPRALEAALVETNAGFNLNGKQMLALDEAGVPDSVIDLIVALSYPDRFVVERSPRGGGGGGSSFGNDPFMLGWAFGYPVWYDDFFYSPYYYRPFGYSRYWGYGGYGGYYGGYGDVIIGVPIDPEPRPSGTGRVVDGQGYTRIRPRDTAMPTDVNGSNTSARTASSAGSDSAPSSSGSSSSGSSSTASGGGYSGGSSSGDTGRTAQPR